MTEIRIDIRHIWRTLWLPLFCLLAGSATLAGCIDDDEWCHTDDDDGTVVPLGPDEYGIRFALTLDALGGSDAATRVSYTETIGNAAENYVNFNTMRILLFDKDDNYICDLLTESNICNVIDRTPNDSNDRLWYVELSVSKLIEKINDGSETEQKIAEAIKECIETTGFKILTLANWDKRALANRVPDFVYGDQEKGHLSYIAHCVNDPLYAAKISEEGEEHEAYQHLIKNGKMGAWYDWTENHFPDTADVYNMMRQGLPMVTDKTADSSGGTEGLGSDGAANQEASSWDYKDTSTASKTLWSKNKGFYYRRTERDGVVYEFRNIWNLWNFSNGVKNPSDKGIAYVNMADEYKTKWQEINEGIFSTLSTTQEFNGLKIPDKSNLADGRFRLQNAVSGENYTTRISSISNKCITFNVETDGTVRIRAKQTNSDGTKKVKIGVQYGTNESTGGRIDEKKVRKIRKYEDVEATGSGQLSGVNSEEYVLSFPVKSSNTSTPIYIFAADNNADVYEVEFVKDTYLFRADRISKEPLVSKGLGIPMYGIQQFLPVGDYWMPGEYFNVSEDSPKTGRKEGYKYRKIWMLRSVAKVEVLVSKTIGGRYVRPSSILLYSVNRTARYEPKDFSTPTNLIWNGTTGKESSDHVDYYGWDPEGKKYPDQNKYHDNRTKGWSETNGEKTIEKDDGYIPGVGEEAVYIRAHGPGRIHSDSLTYSDINPYWSNYSTTNWDQYTSYSIPYRNFTAWLFRMWEDLIPDWNWNNYSNIAPTEDKAPNTIVGDIGNGVMKTVEKGSDLPYPRIFNDRVWRTNSTRFILDRGASTDGYWHYYAYVPDKYIDDADDTGDRSESPKVPSIHIRFAKNYGEDGGFDAEYNEDGTLADDDEVYDEEYNDETNNKDGHAFRIYFTNYDVTKLPTARSALGNYEGIYRNLTNHWPIIRNTLYSFKVNGLNASQVTCTVNNAAVREPEIEFY